MRMDPSKIQWRPVDWRIENSAKNWAGAYDFPAVADKRVILEEFPIKNVGMMQAFTFNIRREKFHDPRVRLAFNYAFDFEEMNKQIFFGQYTRIASYFEGTDLAATSNSNRVTPRIRPLMVR
jgi:microcin C transport system substrate-binding protein